MCKSITRFPTRWGESSLGSLAGQWSRMVLLSTDCPSRHIIIHGNSASHSSNGDIMELVRTSPLSQQDRHQHWMEARLAGPKADAFCFPTAPGGGWWDLSPTNLSCTGLILTAHFNNTLICSLPMNLLSPSFESEFVGKKNTPQRKDMWLTCSVVGFIEMENFNS